MSKNLLYRQVDEDGRLKVRDGRFGAFTWREIGGVGEAGHQVDIYICNINDVYI